MATLWISVFESAAEVAMGAPLQEMTVAIGGASTQSAAIGGSARAHRRIRLLADSKCHVAIGTDPTAGSTSLPLTLEGAEYFFAEAGWKVAVVQRT
jgi:hypothetical protein